MSEESDRPRILRAIKKCLSDAYDHFQQAMDELDEIGKGSVGPGMAPIVGGYAMPNPKSKYRAALIELDAAEKALNPLIKRFRDGRVNRSHFENDDAIRLLGDLAGFDFNILIDKLSEQTGRESVWYRLRETCENVEKIFKSVTKE